jgi:outer membrane protein TolC
VPVGLPSALAQRRPDILGASARLHAATAEIGVAEADFYPRITLVASLGAQAFDEADLGKWSARQFSVGPAIYLPLFEGGKLKRTLELTQSRQRAAAIDYRKTVLQAWHEIDNALNVRVQEQRRHAALERACEQANEALDVARQAHRNGVADHAAVLLAQRDALDNQLALNDSTTAIAVSLVGLYKALGGGWNPQAAP